MFQNKKSFFSVVAVWLARTVLDPHFDNVGYAATSFDGKKLSGKRPSWTPEEADQMIILESRNRVIKLYDLIYTGVGLFINNKNSRDAVPFFNLKLKATFGPEMHCYLEDGRSSKFNEMYCFESICSFLRVSLVCCILCLISDSIAPPVYFLEKFCKRKIFVDKLAIRMLLDWSGYQLLPFSCLFIIFFEVFPRSFREISFGRRREKKEKYIIINFAIDFCKKVAYI